MTKVDWYPYPETHPTTSEQVLVTYKFAEDDYEVSIGEYWDNISDPKEFGFGKFNEYVIGWAELPPRMEE